MEEIKDGGGENLAGDFLAADSTESTNTNIAGRKRTIGQTEGTNAAGDATTASAVSTTITVAQRPSSSSSSQQQQPQNQRLNGPQQNLLHPQPQPTLVRQHRLTGGGCSAVGVGSSGGGVGGGSGSISTNSSASNSKNHTTSSSSSQHQTRASTITPTNAGITQIHMLLISLFIRHEYFTTC
jgi:hypothetical protein